MKFVYYNEKKEKILEITIDKLRKLDKKYIIKDVPPIEEKYKKLLNNVSEEIYVLSPINDGEDFYLEYFNHSSFYEETDFTFEIGGLFSKTYARDDDKKQLSNLIDKIYNEDTEYRGTIKYLNDDGQLVKSIEGHYFKIEDKVILIHEDKSEVRRYREGILNNKNLGVAIYQENHFVEVNQKYADSVFKTREQLLGAAQDFTGMPIETQEMIKREIGNILNRKKLSYKAPIVSYTEDGDIRYYLNAEGSYIVYDNKPAVLFKVKDLTEQEKAKRLIERNDDENIRIKSTLNEIGGYSKTFISYANYPDFFSVTDNFYEVIEDDKRDYEFGKDTLRSFVIGEDLELYDNMIASLSPANPEVEFTCSIMTLKLNIKYIRNYFKRVYDSAGNAIAYISAHQDITEEATYSNSLKKQIYDKNELLKDKDILIKEVHHSIKNNLNIILSLIRMEEHFKNDPNEIIENTKTHIKAISVMHEKTYQSNDLKELDLKDYIDSIVESLLDIYASKIEYISKVNDISLNSSQATSLGLIINELVNNTVKYAFPDNNPGNIQIKLKRIDKNIEVEYRDNGVGIPDSVDFENPNSLGLIVIQNLTKQIDGKIEFSNDNGVCVKIVFKENESF